MDKAVDHFKGIDALINNASAINLSPIEAIAMKRFDLDDANARATFACSQAALPYLKESGFGHILTMSPPLAMQAKWFKDYLAILWLKWA